MIAPLWPGSLYLMTSTNISRVQSITLTSNLPALVNILMSIFNASADTLKLANIKHVKNLEQGSIGYLLKIKVEYNQLHRKRYLHAQPALVAQLDAPSNWRPGGHGFNPCPRSATFFCGDWSWNIFYGHSLPSADSRRAVVSFWLKNVHNTG